MSCIAGGKYIIGSNSKKWTDENPKHFVTLSTFLIDKYEVTTEEYQFCVKSKKCASVISNYKQMRGDLQPQLKTNWYQAKKYCESQKKRLPTEAEFEAASRGTKGEIYPWGNKKATCKEAIIFQKNLGKGCTKKYGIKGSTSNVGSRAAWRYGLYDMAGNAHEWVNDWYTTYDKCGIFCTGLNPKGPCNGNNNCSGHSKKVVKGGSWYWDWEWARGSKRRAYPPLNNPPHHFGFRCVKDILE